MIGVLLLEPPAQIGHLVDEPAVFECLIHQDFEPYVIDRLFDQVIRAQFHRLDRRLNRRETGHHDDGNWQLLEVDRPDQVQPGHPGQFQVGDHEGAGVFDQPFHGGGAIGRNRNLPVRLGEQLREVLAD